VVLTSSELSDTSIKSLGTPAKAGHRCSREGIAAWRYFQQWNGFSAKLGNGGNDPTANRFSRRRSISGGQSQTGSPATAPTRGSGSPKDNAA
jgi:hypothetical protein